MPHPDTVSTDDSRMFIEILYNMGEDSLKTGHFKTLAKNISKYMLAIDLPEDGLLCEIASYRIGLTRMLLM